MHNKVTLVFATLFYGLLNQASAQLVFVPDINFRAALNNRVPGVVDANGYIDTQSFAVQTAVVIGNAEGVNPLVIDWTPADLTGIEGLVALYALALAGEPGTIPVVTLPVLPATVHNLHLREVSVATMPALPVQLETLAMIDVDGAASLAAIPVGLDELHLIELPLFSNIPNWPSNSSVIELIGLDSLTVLPAFAPTDAAQYIRFQGLDLNTLPAWPQGLEELVLVALPNVTEIPAPPATVVDMELGCENLLCLPPFPNGLLNLVLTIGIPYWQCFPNIPPNVQVFFGAFPIGVDNFMLCTPVNSTCPPGAPSVTGRVFLDGNNNGQYDTGEVPYTQVGIFSGGTATGVTNDGRYAMALSVGPHTISCNPNTGYVTSIAPAMHTATFAGVAEVDSLNDFAVMLQPNIQDLVVDLTASTPPVPGFYHQVTISYRNAGTQVSDGSVTFTYGAAVSFFGSSTVPDVINGNTLTWNFAQLQIGEERTVDVMLLAPIGTALGTVVSYEAVVDALPTDASPGDNTSTTVTDVVGSYDPNDKAVSPTALTPAQVAAEERLTYTIRFQNTGTWPATRVVLTDTLSTDLQWNTMQEIAASHAHTWFISNGVLHVVFDNINLPDSNANEPESHGYFKFSMKPVSTLLLGDAVSNTANIYFDFNEPVITNAAVFTVDNNVGTPETAQPRLHLSPNPVSDVLAVEQAGTANNQVLEVVDVTGRTVLRAVANGTRTLLDVHALKAGSYHVRVGDGMVGRFVKR